MPQGCCGFFSQRHLHIADAYLRHGLNGHRLVHRNDTQGKHKRGYCRQEQHHTVHPMERLAGEQQAVEHVKYCDEHRHLEVVYQKLSHIYFNVEC